MDEISRRKSRKPVTIAHPFVRRVTLPLFSAMVVQPQPRVYPRFIFRRCGAIWLEVSDRRPVAFTNLPLPAPRHPRTTMVFSHFRVRARARVAQHSPSARIRASTRCPEWTRSQVLMNLEHSADLEHSQV